jgi:tRNA pseudouridine38-40 synthase
LRGNTVRNIFGFTIEKTKKDLVIFRIAANSFLYNMVRIIVGTVLEVGYGDRDLESINKALVGRDRKLAGKIVPAKGLFLTGVKYLR